MSEKFKEIITDNEPDTDKLQNLILVIASIFTFCFSLVTFLLGKNIIAQSFLMGAVGSLLYLRMQVMFVKSFSKRDVQSILTIVLTQARILIVLGVLLVSLRRVDLFDFSATLAGLASVHLISMLVFTLSIFKNAKKKLITN